jgi:hypothetical protein
LILIFITGKKQQFGERQSLWRRLELALGAKDLHALLPAVDLLCWQQASRKHYDTLNDEGKFTPCPLSSLNLDRWKPSGKT